MQPDKFKTKTGLLTQYALACGYREKTGSHAIDVELWTEAGVPGVYNVRAYNHELHCRLFWLTFTSLTKARWHWKHWEQVTQVMIAH